MSQGASGFSVSLSNTWLLDIVTWGIRAKKSPSTRRGFSVLLKGTLTACTHINTALSHRAYSLLLFMYCRHSCMAPVDPFSRFPHTVLFYQPQALTTEPYMLLLLLKSMTSLQRVSLCDIPASIWAKSLIEKWGISILSVMSRLGFWLQALLLSIQV